MIALPADPFERGLLVWRAISLWSRIAENLAALIRAVAQWQEAGRPNHVNCQIGRDYLRWTPGGGDVRQVLASTGEPDAVRRLLMLPTREVAQQFVGVEDAEAVEQLCARTAADTAAWYRKAAGLVTEDTHRTFIRRKHRMTVTTPSRVPLWLTLSRDLTQDEANEAFSQGFAIIDWLPGKSETSGPELIAWVATSDDYAAYVLALLDGINMMGTVIDGVLRLVTPELAVIPWRSVVPPSERELAALGALEQSEYRTMLAARLV